MYKLYKAIKDRMERYLRASTILTDDASAGDLTISVEDARYFGFDGLNRHVPYVILMDSNTTAERLEDGSFYGGELIKVETVDISANTITFQTPLQEDWLVSNAAWVSRAPGEVVVNDVVIGDLAVVQKFPTVCVNPTNKKMQWYTMPGGTKETCNIEFIIYVEGGGTEQASIDMLKLSEAVEWILMSNLHIQVADETSEFAVVSASLVGDTNYGLIQKGSEFLKSAKLSWSGDIIMVRDYLYNKDTALYPGDMEGEV